MMDDRYLKLANILISYSTALKKNEKIFIDVIDIPDEFVIALMRAAKNAGALPFVECRRSRINREIQLTTSSEHAAIIKDIEMFRMKKMDAYIAIRGNLNANENSDVPAEKSTLFAKTLRPVIDYRVNKTKWVVLRWPSPSMAQAAGMSTEAFEDFFFKVCLLDYSKMEKAMQPLVKLLNSTDQVRIKGPGTDLSFSIKGIGAKPCHGKLNIPDGEVFSCPVKNSVNGVIQFNTPSVYSGTKFENIKLEFKSGKIINAKANNSTKLNQILDTDPGARYLGEFSLGLNPYILEPMCDTLFDEKISGSIHLTPGQAYEQADNGNRSAIHWDMVLIQRPEYGGGEIWFDNRLIRKDGIFVVPELKALNPSNLK
jgi:aminopeptidase